MWASILAGLQALPKLLDILQKLGDAVKKADFDRDMRAIEETVNDLEKAQTLKEKLAAGRKLNDLYKRL